MQRELIAEGGILDYDPHFLSEQEASHYFSVLKEKITWEQKEYINYKSGEKLGQPRLTAWFANDNTMAYSYSGVTQLVQEWTPELLELRQKLEKVTGENYNSVLLNLYRNGQDSVGEHADDEKELGLNAVIASVSLGATRDFVLRQYKKATTIKLAPSITYKLSHGSLLVMSGTTQQYWKHSIPKTKVEDYKTTGARINLTFRKFIKD